MKEQEFIDYINKRTGNKYHSIQLTEDTLLFFQGYISVIPYKIIKGKLYNGHTQIPKEDLSEKRALDIIEDWEQMFKRTEENIR